MQLEKDRKKNRILQCAADVFSKKGYHNTTVKDIASEAGVSIGSFYFYFASKEELFSALYDYMGEIFQEVMAKASQSVRGNIVLGIDQAVKSAFALLREHKDLAGLLLLDNSFISEAIEKKKKAVYDRFLQDVCEILKDLHKRKKIDCPNAEIAACSLVGGIYSVIVRSLYNGETQISENNALKVSAYHLRALGVAFNEAQLEKNVSCIN